MTTTNQSDILTFWFGPDVAAGSWQEKADLWFAGGPQVDAEIRQRFGAAAASAATGALDQWTQSPRGRLALIILLDQFSRNIHRGTAAAFANDPQALALALAGIEQGDDRALAPIERLFLYMPLMHAEDLVMQRRCLALLRTMAGELDATGEEGKALTGMLTGSLKAAEQHLDLIERFGRFPHRNAILGREATPAEAAYLAEGGATFGQTPAAPEEES